MPQIKKRMYLLFFVISLLLPLSVNSQTCTQLSCFSFGKTCVQTASGAQCADYCKDKGLAVAAVGGCSLDKRYCSAGGVLTSKCSVCGCAKGEVCQSDGSCLKVCNDGTKSGQCSAQKPLYCDNGKLVEKSNNCGCDEGKVPQSDGTCGFKSFAKDSTIYDFIYGLQNGVRERLNYNNIALQGTAFASSTYDAPANWGPYKPTPDKVIDGIYTDWLSSASSQQEKNQYIGIEWNEEKTFNQVKFVQSKRHVKSYKVQYFKDGNWIDATKEKQLEYFPKDFELNDWVWENENAFFEPVKARKVRIFFPECYGVCRIREVGVYNSDEDSLGLYTPNYAEGEFISRIIDTGTLKNNVKYENLYFTSHAEGSSGSEASVKLQVRTATITNEGFKGVFTPWTGPDGTSGTFYENSGQAINPVVYKSDSFYSSTEFMSPTATGEKFNTWANPQNAFASDLSYAYKTAQPSFKRGQPISTSCQAFLDLSSNGGNSYEAKKYSNFGSGDLGKGGPALSDGFTFGSTDDLWGRRWYPSDFANSNFRVRISHGVESSGGPSPGAQDYYNFNLPDLSGKKIRGIEVKVQGLCDGTSSESILKVDSIKLNVYLYHETYDKSIITGSHNGKKYIQYRALFSTNDKSKVPFLDDVKIIYSGKFNSKPVVSTKNQEVVLGTPVNFAAIANDIDGKIISYEWDFGNGKTGTGSNPVYSYPNDGFYTVKVTAKDDDGAIAKAKAKVSVNVYDCLSDAAPKSGPAANLFEPADPLIKLKATEALLEYAQSKGIKVKDVDTTLEYYEAANNYITKHMSYLSDGPTWNDPWNGASAKALFQAGNRGCGNKYCGDCEDFAITTTALLRAMGVSPKCAYTACSSIHCYNILNIGGRFRLVEPQKNSLTSEFNSKSYEWKYEGYTSYETHRVFNDEVGKFAYATVGDANPETYTINYPSTSGLPNPSKKCPASYSQWKGQGDQTYFNDKCL